MEYGSMFYSVAPYYSLSVLDKVQNQCLRIALGVRRTSPIISLEVESNVPPLDIFRTLSMLNYYGRAARLPTHLDIKNELFPSDASLPQTRFTGRFIPPLLIRCEVAFRKLNMAKPPSQNVPLVLPSPPWVNYEDVFFPELACIKFHVFDYQFYLE